MKKIVLFVFVITMTLAIHAQPFFDTTITVNGVQLIISEKKSQESSTEYIVFVRKSDTSWIRIDSSTNTFSDLTPIDGGARLYTADPKNPLVKYFPIDFVKNKAGIWEKRPRGAMFWPNEE